MENTTIQTLAPKKLYRILTIDGGGVKGILSGRILEAIEAKLNKLYEKKFGQKRATPIRIAEFFDFVAGTSTGGILTCLLLYSDQPKAEGARDKTANTPKFTSTEAVELYVEHCQQIFSKRFWGNFLLPGLFGPKYDIQKYEALLKKYFGNGRMSDLVRPCLIATYNIETRRTVFFTKDDAVENPDLDYHIPEVVRATSAGPTYFPPKKVNSPNKKIDPIYGVDGGLFANNPSMCAFVEAIKINVGTFGFDEFFIVSVGLATRQKSYDYEKAMRWGLLGWINPIISIMLSGVSETVDYQLRKIYLAIGKKENYIRVIPDLGNADTSDELTTPENIRALSLAGKNSAEKYDADLERIAETIFEQQFLTNTLNEVKSAG